MFGQSTNSEVLGTVAHPVLWTRLCLRCDGLLKVLAPGLNRPTVPLFGDESLLVVFSDEVPDGDANFFDERGGLPKPMGNEPWTAPDAIGFTVHVLGSVEAVRARKPTMPPG